MFCQQEGLQVDAERFVNYYTASGWYQGSTPIRAWRACVRNWHRGERKPASGAVRSAGEMPAAGEAKPSPFALQAIQRMLAEEAAQSEPPVQ